MGILAAVLLLPLLGAAMAGRELAMLWQFPPPLEIPWDYRRFSWAAAGMVIAVAVSALLPWITAARRWRTMRNAERARRRFPTWGWAALTWTIVWWILAWTRFDGFWALQRFTFFPLWLGFIVTVNALVEWRSGTCLMRRAPRRWLALFAGSAAFWWVFEWLNRFVRNWHYLGVQDFGPAEYALHATICFATVLPAVSAVAEWLTTFPSWIVRVERGPKWQWLQSRRTAWWLAWAAGGALVLTGALPRWFYPALWIAPLALLLAQRMLMADRGVAAEMARGDWSRAATWMAAALVCGFFWELWNWHSAAKWIYTVPGVQRWHVFEMPLLGYLGYLPFGLECLLAVNLLVGDAGTAVKTGELKRVRAGA